MVGREYRINHFPNLIRNIKYYKYEKWFLLLPKPHAMQSMFSCTFWQIYIFKILEMKNILGVKVDKFNNSETLFIYFLSTNDCPFLLLFGFNLFDKVLKVLGLISLTHRRMKRKSIVRASLSLAFRGFLC